MTRLPVKVPVPAEISRVVKVPVVASKANVVVPPEFLPTIPLAVIAIPYPVVIVPELFQVMVPTLIPPENVL